MLLADTWLNCQQRAQKAQRKSNPCPKDDHFSLLKPLNKALGKDLVAVEICSLQI